MLIRLNTFDLQEGHLKNCNSSGHDLSELFKTVKNESNSLVKWITANKQTINFDPKKSIYLITMF